MPHPKPDPEAQICKAALQLAGRNGWNTLTPEAIAKAAKIPVARLRTLFSDKNEILPVLVAWVDRQVAAAIGKIDTQATPRDRLFEIFMARFDILQKYRQGILSILEACRHDPALAPVAILPAQIGSMRQALSLARLASGGRRESLARFGLLAVYYRALWCWRKDRTRDMAITMAALDQALRCAGSVAEVIWHNK